MASNILVVDIINYIDNFINKKITIDELSKKFYYNKDYIMRIFKKELNMTIIEYINRKRIYHSLEYLKDNNMKILKISLKLGYLSGEYFCETFNKYIGVNPITYRKYCNGFKNINNIDMMITNIINLKYSLSIVEKYKQNIYHESSRKLSLYK